MSRFEFDDPTSWRKGHWVVIAFMASVAAPAWTLDTSDQDWGTAGHQVVIGLALLEYAIAYHLYSYPHLVTEPAALLAGLAVAAWQALPTVYWVPWHVTSTLGLVGLAPLANGLRLAYGGKP